MLFDGRVGLAVLKEVMIDPTPLKEKSISGSTRKLAPHLQFFHFKDFSISVLDKMVGKFEI